MHYRKTGKPSLRFKNAPLTLLDRIREVPGVNEADGRVVFDASLDMPGLDEPASGLLVSLRQQTGIQPRQQHHHPGHFPR